MGRIPGLERHIRAYRNGRDLTQLPRGVLVIDLFGLNTEEARSRFPEVYQWVLERVKPERDQNNRETYRKNWWLFGEPRKDMRPTLKDLDRYIATVETSKHRFFTFLDAAILPDNMLVNIAVDDAFFYGILTSRLHVIWALATGGRLGVGNDPRYNKTRCFETFPFPDPTPDQKGRIRELAEQIDAHRKRQQAQYPGLTLTDIYNLLEKLRKQEPLTPKERTTHQQGIVTVLQQFHDDLDRAVFAAYGWQDLTAKLVGRPGATTPWPEKPDHQAEAEEALLQRLVDLNHQRAAEEHQGLIRRLRPDYQDPEGTTAATGDPAALAIPTGPVATDQAKTPWPRTLPEQVQALRAGLDHYPQPATAKQLVQSFKGAQLKRVGEILDTLVAMGQAREDNGKYAGA